MEASEVASAERLPSGDRTEQEGADPALWLQQLLGCNTGYIAQLVEHLTVEACSNQMVPGSIPGGRICQHSLAGVRELQQRNGMIMFCVLQNRCSIVVSISACHAEDPGSIPGGGVCARRRRMKFRCGRSTEHRRCSDPL